MGKNTNLVVGCRCQGCGKKYTVDLIIPDFLWEKIKPKGKSEGAGLLCGSCIMERLESFYQNDSFAFQLFIINN